MGQSRTMVREQSIDLPLTVGSRITLYKSVDFDGDSKLTSILFEDRVERYNPDTGLLEFRDSDVGLSEFESLIDEAVGYEVMRNY